MIPVKIKIINNDGKVAEIENPYSIIAVGDRVTISYPEQEHSSWTQTTTFFIATMEITPLNNSNNMQSPETPCPTSDISLPDEVLPEVCEVGARGRDNSASKNQNKIKETTKC